MAPVKLIVLCCCAAAASAKAGTVFKWVDENGILTYSDAPPPDSGPPSVQLETADSPQLEFDVAEYLGNLAEDAQRARTERENEREQRAAQRREAEEQRRSADPFDRADYDYSTSIYPVYVNSYLHPKYRRRHGFPGHHRPPKHRPPSNVPLLTPVNRSFRLPGAHRRFGHLGHRLTHREE